MEEILKQLAAYTALAVEIAAAARYTENRTSTGALEMTHDEIAER